MNQESFNTIQNNFKKFLRNESHPIKEMSHPITHLPDQRIERMEKTYAFGREDCEIGYKISITDEHGNRTTKIVPT